MLKRNENIDMPKICIQMFKVPLSMTSKWENPQSPSSYEWMYKMWYVFKRDII